MKLNLYFHLHPKITPQYIGNWEYKINVKKLYKLDIYKSFWRYFINPTYNKEINKWTYNYALKT